MRSGSQEVHTLPRPRPEYIRPAARRPPRYTHRMTRTYVAVVVVQVVVLAALWLLSLHFAA